MSNSVQSVGKAMQILELLAQAQRALSLAEISQATGWPKSTVHGLLTALMEHSAVEQSQQDGKYYMGIRMFEFGCVVSNSWNITAASRQPMKHLALKTMETAFLSALDSTETVLLDSIEAEGALRIVSPIGTRTPVYCNSQGKVLLAYQSPGNFQSIIKKLHFQKYTPRTADNAADLQSDCELIRRQGFYVEKGEYRMGLCSVAAPVFDSNGSVRFSIGVVGMFPDVHSDVFQNTIQDVVECARAISHNMGYRER